MQRAFDGVNTPALDVALSTRDPFAAHEQLDLAPADAPLCAVQ